ncbi:MAG: hypothetical protein NTY18_14435 [Deltaproteobacteria bacterium]|nr:hypothetical protein [Deltaproteobacteria bacterium]
MTDRILVATRPWMALAAATAVAAGCASMRIADERQSYFRAQLDTYQYAQGCLDVWPAALKLLGSKGYPLQGRDRQYAGQGKESGLAAFVDQGYETRAVEGGGLVVRTGWLPSSEGASRYQVTGSPGQPSGCAVTFIRIWRGTIDPSDNQEQADWKVQLELLEQLDAAAASRIGAGAPKG